MAIVTFGNTARSSNALGLKNTGSSNLIIGLLRNTVIAPGTTKFLTFADFDARLRGTNLHNNQLYTVNGDNSAYLDDVSELAKLVTNGTIQVYTATFTASSSTFTAGASAAFTADNDGSAIFS